MARDFTIVQPLPPGDHGPAFRGPPEAWLPDPRPAGASQWQVRLRVAGVSRLVRCRVGDPWTTRDGIQRRVEWVPMAENGDVLPVEKWLPTMDGELFLVGPTATPSLLLTGEADVPLGWLGEAVDAMVLGRVTQRTVSAFLQDVARRLAGAEEDAADEPVAHPSSSGTHQRS